MSMSLVEAITIIISMMLSTVGNRVIGNPDLVGNIPLRRVAVYTLNGLLAAILVTEFRGFDPAYVLVASIWTALGYAIFRQPGPDMMFLAANGRAPGKVPDEAVLVWIMKYVHRIPESVFINGSPGDLVKVGILSGVWRGLLLLPLAIAMSYFWPYAWVLGFLGVTWGGIFWISGVYGPWKTEVNCVTRAELLTGALLVFPTYALPIIIGG